MIWIMGGFLLDSLINICKVYERNFSIIWHIIYYHMHIYTIMLLKKINPACRRESTLYVDYRMTWQLGPLMAE